MYVKDYSDADIMTEYGHFNIRAYRNENGGPETVVLIHRENDAGPETVPVVRIHSECLTGDIFASMHCDCHAQLVESLKIIGSSSYGVLIYLRQEGRGIGLYNKLKTYRLQAQGMDTVEANLAIGKAPDLRSYGDAADILSELGVREIRLLTNNPDKVSQLQNCGFEVHRLPLIIPRNKYNERYINTKRDKMNHWL
jgi:3,4-dihydroxy 2-butanone 4-phosphate synthase/GTP cyclohydrolase II